MAHHGPMSERLDPPTMSPKAAIALLVDHPITGAFYLQMPGDASGAVEESMVPWDIADYGLDLSLATGTLGITWSVSHASQGLVFIAGSVAQMLHPGDFESIEAGRWGSRLGRRISRARVFEERPERGLKRRPLSLALTFEDRSEVAIAAANRPSDDQPLFYPFGDELVIFFDSKLARISGLVR